MEIIDSTTFDSVIHEGVTLVDFFATWCGPCKMMAPVLEQLSREMEGKAKIVKVDVDESEDLAVRFGIMSIPTMILFKDGNAVEMAVGFHPKPQIAALLNRHIA
ncbi:MAG: thioredoxin [Erysipelotrichales bacterium]|nr:thioredoxin [Erysipelotrichales bacterium]MBQ1386568.1 thioredoxin [Erysipelotrichales bacterium]MBQ2309673.1 thioredoxin [Erysipelotrichales bacterium]MBQ5543241.1 thioredoxin [Erysipelotrichales bacterium]